MASGAEVLLSLNNQAPGTLLGMSPRMAFAWVLVWPAWGQGARGPWEDQEVEGKET